MPIPAGPGQDPADLAPELSTVVGDPRQPELTVNDEDGNPGDGTTAVTCTVTAPDGTATTLATSSPDGGETWTAAGYTVDSPGRWVECWTVTGRGADVLYTVVLVHAAPTPGGQTWIPTREQVASHIPRRTHVGSTTGYGMTLGTFTESTRPTAQVCDALISQAAQWIELAAGPITVEAVVDGARTATAMRAAGLIEFQYGDKDDRPYAERLLAEAASLRKDVVARNVVETGTDPAATVVMPVWSFPPAPSDSVPW